jgi:hypothetical protein
MGARPQLAGLLVLVLVSGAARGAAEPRLDETGPVPRPVPPPKREAVDQGIARGVRFLIERQNPDGSWGSARNTKGLNIYAPVPGAHHAFRGAVTSLCIAALCEVGGDDPAVAKALGSAEAWLLEHLPRLRRATPRAVYNVWGHAYGIQSAVRLLKRDTRDAERQKRLRDLIRQQVDMLTRYECVNGGWGYYDFNHRTQKPGGRPNSFVTATVVLALHEAREAEITPPDRIVRRGIDSILRQRNPDSSYYYSEPFRWRPQHPINRPGGSLGRSQACNAALRAWGDARITDDVLKTWLRRLAARNEWLGMGRKRPVPHESWFGVAGYFYYYGHYYAGLCIDMLPAAERAPFQDQIATILLRLQEKDGSWWDYPLYDYHQQYGTAYALMTLGRCRR